MKTLLPLALFMPAALQAAEYRDIEIRETPFEMPILKEWIPPAASFPITGYGADGTLEADTKAFKEAIAAASKSGGGRVLVPAGEWKTGPIHLKSNIELHLSEGATVRFTDDPKAYEPFVASSWEGVELMNLSPLVYAYGCTNVAITGKGTLAPEMGTWKKWFARPPSHMAFTADLYRWCSENAPLAERVPGPGAQARPHLIHFNRSANIVLDGFRIRESPFWTIHLYHSENAIVRNLDVSAHGHNNDGIDIEMTKNVLVEKCRFDQGDDAVVLKAGRNMDGWRLDRPTENVVVRDCSIVDGHVLLGIGSEMSGGVRNVLMHDCHASGDVINIFYMKTNRRRGGFIENIWIRDCSAANARRSVVGVDTDVLYQWRDFPTYEERLTRIENINAENLICGGSADHLLMLYGDKDLPIDGVHLESVLLGKARKDWIVVKNARNVTIDGERYPCSLIPSPDGRYAVELTPIPGAWRKVTLVDSVADGSIDPKTWMIDYLKPGDPVPWQRPLLRTPGGGKIDLDRSLFPNPWSLDHWSWKKDSSAFRFLYNERGHGTMRIIEASTNGTARILFEEKAPTFFDYSSKLYLKFLDRTDEFIWMSERSGWNHLYLCDGRTGEVKNAITSGEWVVKSVESVDERARKVYFMAVGVVPGQDPYYEHYCSVNFDGTGFKVLTEGNGTHSIKVLAGGREFEDRWSRVDMPPTVEIRSRLDGRLVRTVSRGDPDFERRRGWRSPEMFSAPGRDGETMIYGIIWKPRDFDPAKRYPVIESIYAGPQDAFVPKAFTRYSQATDLADCGFIVVQIDGMGTNWRSRKFHDVAWKNLADAGFPDRIAWMKAAAATRPWMDLERVGIYGGSAGGQSAVGALIWHNDFYKAAVADSGCHDNRIDKVWWNEQWMGWPVGKEYEQSSNIVNASRLKGELLLMYGEMDDNVDPASTTKLADALMKAGKDFEMLLIPGGRHCSGLAGGYGWEKLKKFFSRKLVDIR